MVFCHCKAKCCRVTSQPESSGMQRGPELKGKQKDEKGIERRGVSVSECHHKIPSCSCCLGMPAIMSWTLNSELKPFLPHAAIIRVFYHSSSEIQRRGTVLRAAETSQTATRLSLTLHVTKLYLLGHLAFLSP